MRKLILLCSFLITANAFTQTLGPFQQRFEFVRRDGKLVKVLDNSIGKAFSIMPYVEFIKEALINEQETMIQEGVGSGSQYEENVLELFEVSEKEILAGRNKRASELRELREKRENVNNLLLSLKEVGKLNIEKIFNNPKFNEVIGKFEVKLFDAIDYLDPRIIAKPDSSNFFVIRNRAYEAVRFGLNLAKRQLGEIPLLNTASYVIVEIEKMIRTRRQFHQNMLLHYLEKFTPEELGLSREEVDHVFSSVYESRIAWFAFWESRRAEANWDNFGFNQFGSTMKMGSYRLLDFKDTYDKSAVRINYAFSDAIKEGEDVIVNLVDFESTIKREPAIAFSRTNPEKIKRKRMLLQLGQLGLSFVPISDWIKGIAESFLKSMYEQQQITEGALYGYFESNSLYQDQELLKKQYMNPFDKL